MPAVPSTADTPVRPAGRSPWRRAALALLAVLVLAWPVGWIVGSRIARGVFVREAERLFDARLEVGSVQFLPPCWLIASDLALSSGLGGERIDWVRAQSLRVTLAGWPSGGLPPMHVTVDGPVLTVVRTPDGLLTVLDRWRGGDTIVADAGAGAAPGPAASPADGTSDGGRLPITALELASARLDFVDRTTPAASPPPVPLGVGGFDVSAWPGEGGVVDVTVSGGDAHLRLDGRGSYDLATHGVAIASLDAHVRVGAAAAGAVAEVDVEHLTGSVQPDARSARIDGASVTIAGEPPIVADGVEATLALGDGRLDASDVASRVAGGNVHGTFGIRWDEAPSWQASGEASGLRLADLARRFPQLGGDGVRGALSASGTFSGAIGAREDAWLASLEGSGRMRARDGRFYTIPLVSRLLEQAGLSDAGTTLTEASAEFRVADGTVHLDEAALGSTAVGVQGHGDVGFDGRVQLDMVVLPFGSWRSAVERGNVPVLGGVLAKLAGKAQQIVGKASGALYAFRITGTVQDPRLTPVPVPALTKSATDALERLASDAAKDE
ncbi:MAG: AsmA-like C-terminal region-containing protein [Candidatus Binatia bacterium]